MNYYIFTKTGEEMEREQFPTLITPFLRGEIDNVIDRYRAVQGMIDTGQAWSLEGHYGRQAAEMIQWGLCVKAADELTEDHLAQWEIEQDDFERERQEAIKRQWTFSTVVIDPPWNERGGGHIKRGADRHYPLMKTHDIIKTIYRCEYWDQIEENAHLYMWVTNNFLEDGLFVMKALGFRYVTNFVWVKEKIGLGQYFRGQHEICLFGTRGTKPTAPRTESKSVPSILKAKKTKHSAKPETSYNLIEQRSKGHYLEIFARAERGEDWVVWGNEV
jgi:N6-adenosine-specific RNA methylase IME4